MINLTSEERERIISEEYADLLIDYSGDLSFLENFEDATVNIINFFHAVVHVPVEQITDDILVIRSYSVMPSLFGVISQVSLEQSGITRLRSIPAFNLRGQGVLIGIMDTGIDYTNSIFQYADGTTRIASIWDQTIVSDNFPPEKGFGTIYTREQINQALLSENPLQVVPTMDEVGHGTMVAGIAAGNEVAEAAFSGVAPDSELVVVKLKPAKAYLKDFFRVPQDAICFQENDLIFAFDYLMETAINLNRPIAICIALGTSQGAHDGMGTLSSYISHQAEARGVSVIIAAGNEGNARRHFSGIVNPAKGYETVELNIGENEESFSMELWGDPFSIFSVDILSPSGEYIPRITARLNENRKISFLFERTNILIDFQVIESQSGDQLILFRFTNPDPGIWRFNVYSRGSLELGFHIWLPMQGFISNNTFFIRSDPYTTILSLGNAIVPITATAYDGTDDSLYIDASRGYSRIGAVKPGMAAPGVNIIGPTLNNDFRTYTGTSAAAAHLAGVAAILLEWGIVKGFYPDMNTIDMKMFLIRGAVRDPQLQYPNRDWGYGIVDVFSTFDRLRTELNT